MIDLGTVRPGSTIRIPFSSFDKDDGSAITMTNYAAADILVYKNGSTTERASTAGFTATTDFDGKTGKHLAIIDLSDNTTADFWNAGAEYLVAIDQVTIDAVVTGGWIARFVIGYPDAWLNTTIATLSTQTSFTLTNGAAEDNAYVGHYAVIHDIASAVQSSRVLITAYTGASKTVTLAAGATFTAAAGDNISIMGMAPLQATTLANKLDVSSGGEAGLDWANIGSPTTVVGLSGTTVKTATDVETDTQDIQARLPAALVGGRMDSSVGAMANNVLTAAAINADAITAAKVAADVGTEIGTAVWATATRELTALDEDNTAIDLNATAVGSVAGAVGSVTGNVGGNVVGSVGSVTAGVTVTTNNDKTGYTLTADFRIKKNTALANFTFLMVDTSDVPKTGLTVTAERSIDGAALGACANAVSEISNGLYKINLAAADLNGDVIALRFSAAGAKDRIIAIVTQTE